MSDQAPQPLVIDGEPLSIGDVVQVARERRGVRLGPGAIDAIRRGRAVVDRALISEQPIYGVTTGFGALSDVVVSPDDRSELQANLLRSHAVGAGERLPRDVVRAALLLRAVSLSKGYSGVRVELVQLLLDLLNHDLNPVVPAQGSVGASGDLAPLAHLALPVIGEGYIDMPDGAQPARVALAAAGLAPIRLEAKEALALINGSQVASALAALAVDDGRRLLAASQIAAALSFEALGGRAAALSPQVQAIRPHPGQVAVAANLRGLLARDGELPPVARRPVQDRYTLRCLPQVIGPVRHALDHVVATVAVEINSVTDNPLCFPETDEIISGGNFHGHPLALTCDYLKLALTSLGNFSERRIASLVDPRASELPAFLTPAPGLNSGYMIAHYVTASLASENKVLAHPASSDTIPTSADVEDYNSMGATAARHLRRVLDNTRRIIATELVCAAQAIDLRGEGVWGDGTSAAYTAIRSRVPFVERDDRPLDRIMAEAEELIQSGALEAAVIGLFDGGDD